MYTSTLPPVLSFCNQSDHRTFHRRLADGFFFTRLRVVSRLLQGVMSYIYDGGLGGMLTVMFSTTNSESAYPKICGKKELFNPLTAII